MITIHVPTDPIAQPRVRATVRGEHAAVYTPVNHPVTGFKAMVRMHARKQLNGSIPIVGPVSVDCTFVFRRPKCMVWKSRPMPRSWRYGKPDRDNLDKAVLDALSGLAYRDDCQVCAGEILKFYAAGDELPHVLIEISELEPIE